MHQENLSSVFDVLSNGSSFHNAQGNEAPFRVVLCSQSSSEN